MGPRSPRTLSPSEFVIFYRYRKEDGATPSTPDPNEGSGQEPLRKTDASRYPRGVRQFFPAAIEDV